MRILLTKKLAEAVLAVEKVCAREGMEPDNCDWDNLVEWSTRLYPELKKELP